MSGPQQVRPVARQPGDLAGRLIRPDAFATRLTFLNVQNVQTALLNGLLAGRSWQIEINFYFTVVIVAAALYRDRSLLLFGAGPGRGMASSS